ILSALLFGLIPAIQSTRPNLSTIIKTGEEDVRRKRFLGGYALVVIQIAGSMILLVATTQGRRNFTDMLAGNPGFQRDHRITMRFNPAANGYDDTQTQRFYETVVQRAREVNGVKSAALTNSLPMTFDFETQPVVPEGYEFPADGTSVDVLSYTVDY